jgi:hypothetical protein
MPSIIIGSLAIAVALIFGYIALARPHDYFLFSLAAFFGLAGGALVALGRTNRDLSAAPASRPPITAVRLIAIALFALLSVIVHEAMDH